MRKSILALLGATLLSACANANGDPPGSPLVSAVGAPFYIALKIPVCAATIAMGGLAAGVQGLAPDSEDFRGEDVREDVDSGVRQNCGPPYVLAP